MTGDKGIANCISLVRPIGQRIVYQDIHNAGKCKDKSDVKECEEVSVGGEGGEEEADEGDAAEVGGGQGEKAKNHLHHSSHP